MNVLNLTLNPGAFKNITVCADGEPVSMRKMKDGSYAGTVETESDKVEISVCKIFELNGRHWFLWGLLFFLISCLGIFNARYDKKCFSLNYKTVLSVNGENNALLLLNAFTEGGRAVELGSDCPAEETVNVYYTDRQVQKRRKSLILTGLFIWLAAIAVAVTAVIISL